MEEFETKIKLRGTVTEVTYRNDVNGYTVFTLDMGEEEITVVGTAPDVREHDTVEAVGDYTYHSVYGRQFKADSCYATVPETVDDLYHYLSSGAIWGVGEATARAIVERFKEKSFEILENYPERLAEIRGISSAKAKKIGEEYKRQFTVRSLLISLSGLGLTTRESLLAFENFGTAAKEMVESDPYSLCEFENGVSFDRAEQIASSLPVPPSAERRIEAGIIHIIRHNLNNGHTCIPLEKMFTPALGLLSEPREKIEEIIYSLAEKKCLVIKNIKGKEFLFAPEVYYAENGIARRLQVLLKYPPEDPENVNAFIDEFEDNTGFSFAELQRIAIETAVNKGILILTGGPGTGKTTTLNGIIKVFENKNLDIALCAPTGRAAQRMTEATGRSAMTIHRLLEVEWRDEKPYFKRNLRNPLECQAVIIDEMSMVDVFVFNALIEALPFGSRLIMVGDSDQLPSVGAGNVLHDLIESGLLPVVELKEIFRQSRESNIVMNAHRIVHGEHIRTDYKDGDFFVLHKNFPLDAVRTINDLYMHRIPDTYGFDSKTQIQVLCPSKKGDTGTYNLNRVLQNSINPPSEEKAEIKTEYRILREGDKVMQIKNNYDIRWESETGEGDGIYNGDIGFIERIDHRNGYVIVDFAGKRATYSKEQLIELEHAFAVTVHKSQGSEFEAVIMPVISVTEKLCYRNLLYTAVTRAKKLLILVGTDGTIMKMIDNGKTKLRFSALKDFLLDNYE